MNETLNEKYELIQTALEKETSLDPVKIAQAVMRNNFVSMHGPEHHFLDGAAFLKAYQNAGGEIDLPHCLEELKNRSIKMPGAMCGYWGVCGSLASVGAALSIVHGTGPLSNDSFYQDHMQVPQLLVR